MKACYRKLYLMIIAFIVLITVARTWADDTVVDQVALAYNESGSVLLLGMTGNDRVSLRIYSGIGASVPGIRATVGGGATSESLGGRLKYTLYQQGTSKITVQALNTDYNNDALSVQIRSIGTGGSGNTGNLQGSTASPGYLTYIPISQASARDLLTGIDGVNTWTGTTRTDGAQVKYRLAAKPYTDVNIVRTVDVLYTIINQ
jgi:hypothetical protein